MKKLPALVGVPESSPVLSFSAKPIELASARPSTQFIGVPVQLGFPNVPKVCHLPHQPLATKTPRKT